jgi:hypothetical protein
VKCRPLPLIASLVSAFDAISPATGQSVSDPPAGSPIALLSDDQRSAWKERAGDAWWTGPVIAASPDTLPPGHVHFEPSFYDVFVHGSATPALQGSLLYGVTARFSAGLIPSLSAATLPDGRRRLRAGDLTLNFRYRLTRSDPQKVRPTVALVLRERLPTAPFDNLKTPPAPAGSGDFGTTVGFYAQQYFWLPNGRILRGRFNISHTFESRVRVSDISVYGTPDGFRGEARPGSSTTAVVAAEYSLTKRWVLAIDLLHQSIGRTVSLSRHGTKIILPAQRYFALVPAVEYNWSSREGVIIGSRWILKGRGKTASWTPVAAYSRKF